MEPKSSCENLAIADRWPSPARKNAPPGVDLDHWGELGCFTDFNDVGVEGPFPYEPA